jgi:hypothetical protein
MLLLNIGHHLIPFARSIWRTPGAAPGMKDEGQCSV